MEIEEEATLVDRIKFYVDNDDRQKAKALAKLGDFLEECYAWDLNWS